MRVSITCEECGRRHQLARSVRRGGPIWIVCHGCELPLRTEPLGPLAGARVRRRRPACRRGPLWAGLFEPQAAQRTL